MRIDVDKVGFDRVNDVFRSFNEKTRKRIMQNALRAGGRVFNKRLIGTRIKPGGTGNLRRGYRNAYVKAKGGLRTDQVISWVSIPRRGGAGAPHAHLYEWGTKKRQTKRRITTVGGVSAGRSFNRGKMPAFHPMGKALRDSWPTMRTKMGVSVENGISRAWRTKTGGSGSEGTYEAWQNPAPGRG